MLRLDGQDVPDGTSVSTEQFARLTYTTGAGGSQTIVVVAQTGARQPGLPDGSLGALIREADSPAVQITAHVTGSRSINAMGALTTSTGTDVGIAGIVQQAGIFTGWTGWLGGTTKLDTARFDRPHLHDGSERFAEHCGGHRDRYAPAEPSRRHGPRRVWSTLLRRDLRTDRRIAVSGSLDHRRLGRSPRSGDVP